MATNGEGSIYDLNTNVELVSSRYDMSKMDRFSSPDLLINKSANR